MTALLDHIDPDGLLEYSVVFTDRSLNHMSQSFQSVMRDISSMLKEVYNAKAVALIPGGGSYAMEAVARQFGGDAHALIVRNGWFSYRWSQIFDAGQIHRRHHRLHGAPDRQWRHRPPLPPPPSKRSWQRSAKPNRTPCLPRMWKHRPV